MKYNIIIITSRSISQVIKGVRITIFGYINIRVSGAIARKLENDSSDSEQIDLNLRRTRQFFLIFDEDTQHTTHYYYHYHYSYIYINYYHTFQSLSPD